MSTSGTIGSITPVLWCDWNTIRDDGTVVARKDSWFLPLGTRVLLDDREGTKCYCTVVGVPAWGDGQYVTCKPYGEWEHYDL